MGVIVAGMCVRLGPSVPAQTAGSAGARGTGVPSPQLCPRMECAALGVEKDSAREVGQCWEAGRLLPKTASVPLEAEPTSLGLVVGRPLH